MEPNKHGLKRGQWSREDDKLLRNYFRTHGHDCSCSLQKCSENCRLRSAQNLDNKRMKPQTSDSKRPVQVYRPTVQTSGGSISAQTLTAPNPESQYFQNPLMEQLLQTSPHIFPGNPTSRVTLVPVPVPVPVPVFTPPTGNNPTMAMPMPMFGNAFPISSASQAPPPPPPQSFHILPDSSVHNLATVSVPGNLNALSQQYAQVVPPPLPMKEQTTKRPECSRSSELVAPELQFPDDITEVEPLEFSPDDLFPPASSSYSDFIN